MRFDWAMLVAVGFAPAAFGQIGNIPGTGYTGAPYNAVETMVDGAGTRTVLLSRDSQGRTRQEYIVRQTDGSELHNIRIIDPKEGVTLMWTTGNDAQSRVVSMTPLPMPQRRTGPVPEEPDPAPGSRRCGGGCSAEIFAPQQINGYRCRGFRVKRIVRDPSTKQASIETTENWSSPELGIILRHVEVDALSGRNTSEITNIVPGEPDPLLFLPPHGYTVQPTSVAGW